MFDIDCVTVWPFRPSRDRVKGLEQALEDSRKTFHATIQQFKKQLGDNRAEVWMMCAYMLSHAFSTHLCVHALRCAYCASDTLDMWCC